MADRRNIGSSTGTHPRSQEITAAQGWWKMHAKSLDEPQWPDGRAGYFASGLRSAEAVAAYHQRVIGRIELVDVVPEQVRAAFDQLRELYEYGAL